jgi:hypothetical protein
VTQNIPTDRMLDVPQRPTLLPTARPPLDTSTAIALDTDFVDHLAEGGYPDYSEEGVKFAAAQRAMARGTDTRNAATVGPADTGALTPAGPTRRRWSNLAAPAKKKQKK